MHQPFHKPSFFTNKSHKEEKELFRSCALASFAMRRLAETGESSHSIDVGLKLHGN
jgi:hypothetical protein